MDFGGCSSVGRPALEDVHQLERDYWVKPGSIADVLRCGNVDGNVSKKEEKWKIVAACIWWSIWIERNKRCFEGTQNNIQNLKMNCLGLY